MSKDNWPNEAAEEPRAIESFAIEISGSATPMNLDDAKASAKEFAKVAEKKNVPNFESYLIENFKNNVSDHVLRCHHHENTTTFYIHPANINGVTLDFEVSNNVLFEPLVMANNSVSKLLTYEQHIGLDVNFAVAHVHGLNRAAGWWTDIKTGDPLQRNVGELLMLIVSELSEAAEDSPQYNLFLMEITKAISRAMEGHRKNKMDDKLPHRKMIEVELADAVIRIMDLAGGLGLDLGGALTEKLLFNQQRADHKIENRLKDDGKKY